MNELVNVTNLTISFHTDEGVITAVRNVDLRVNSGETLGLVGESGSGKSVSTKALMRLLPTSSIMAKESTIRYRTKSDEVIDIAKLAQRDRALQDLRGGEIGMIFQEPMASFSPVYTIGNQMVESIRLHREKDKNKARKIAINMLAKVGISNPEVRFTQYPHEMSGGMRQRAMIALALSTEPALLIADEPTTALDVTIQAQVLELMKSLQAEIGMSIIFISHDLGVIAQIADNVSVMYLGTIVEQGPTEEIIRDPKHPYTLGLLEAIPSLERLDSRLQPIPGDIPSPLERPTGCPFHPRCGQIKKGLCDVKPPPQIDVSEKRRVTCWLYNEKEMSAA